MLNKFYYYFSAPLPIRSFQIHRKYRSRDICHFTVRLPLAVNRHDLRYVAGDCIKFFEDFEQRALISKAFNPGSSRDA